MKLIFSFIFSIGLFAQTGIPYYNNGVLTYLRPIGGVIVDLNRKQIRTAINGGLRGTPNQLWFVNSNGDGEAIDVDWNTFALLPPGTNGKKSLTIKKQPQLSVIPSVKIISDREIEVCSECTPETPFVYRTHLEVNKITKPCKIIFPNDVTLSGWVDIKVIPGYNFFGSLHEVRSNNFPSTTPEGQCSTLNVSENGLGTNFPDNKYPWYLPIARVDFDGNKFTKIDYKLTPYYNEDIRFIGYGVSTTEVTNYIEIGIFKARWSPRVFTVFLTNLHIQSKEIIFDRSNLSTYPMWVYRNGVFQSRNVDYTINYENLGSIVIKFADNINMSINDIITVISVD